MAINRNRHKEEQSTISAAKKGTQTLGKSSSNGKHDKFMSPEQVQGGRETTDKKEVKEAKNASMMGHIVQQGGSSSKSKDTSSSSSSTSSTTSNSSSTNAKKESKSKPTLAQVKKKVKPTPSSTELWRKTDFYKYASAKSELRSQIAKQHGASDSPSINLRDMIIGGTAEREMLSDSRLKRLANQYGVDIDDVTDVNRDGVINETDIAVIANNKQSNPREALSTGSVPQQEQVSPANEVEQPQPEQTHSQPDIFTQGADMARSYFNG